MTKKRIIRFYYESSEGICIQKGNGKVGKKNLKKRAYEADIVFLGISISREMRYYL
jgi:hypothetical protein